MLLHFRGFFFCSSAWYARVTYEVRGGFCTFSVCMRTVQHIWFDSELKIFARALQLCAIITKIICEHSLWVGPIKIQLTLNRFIFGILWSRRVPFSLYTCGFRDDDARICTQQQKKKNRTFEEFRKHPSLRCEGMISLCEPVHMIVIQSNILYI